ncbi:MAG TPA: hypothetical protein DEH78_29215, partial [Solibacterales bacterium]|nr:hypothetical protein [Bryobacterales bacterium]
MPDVRQGPLRNVDMTLNKYIRFKEGVRVAIQGRAYNIFNQVTFTGPSVISVNQANFGSAGGARGAARR